MQLFRKDIQNKKISRIDGKTAKFASQNNYVAFTPRVDR